MLEKMQLVQSRFQGLTCFRQVNNKQAQESPWRCCYTGTGVAGSCRVNRRHSGATWSSITFRCGGEQVCAQSLNCAQGVRRCTESSGWSCCNGKNLYKVCAHFLVALSDAGYFIVWQHYPREVLCPTGKLCRCWETFILKGTAEVLHVVVSEQLG